MFHNLNPNIKPKNLFDILKWKLTSNKKSTWSVMPDLISTDIPPAKITDNAEIRVSYVGHVTFLIQVGGLNILTDPVWSDRASPFTFAGPKRIIKPGINFDDLPKIDVILISHNHYDHLDIPTIKNLWQRDKPKIITPSMNEVIIKKYITEATIISLKWGEKTLVAEKAMVKSFDYKVEFCLEPAQHWSARGVFDKNKALWGTFIIKTNIGDICFIGDSGYNTDIFKDIGNKYNILLSLIPIGAYEPRWFMSPVHMNPEEAVLTHLDLRSKYSIASHFDVFQLADEAFNQAPLELKQAIEKYNIINSFIIPKVSDFFLFDRDGITS